MDEGGPFIDGGVFSGCCQVPAVQTGGTAAVAVLKKIETIAGVRVKKYSYDVVANIVVLVRLADRRREDPHAGSSRRHHGYVTGLVDRDRPDGLIDLPGLAEATGRNVDRDYSRRRGDPEDAAVWRERHRHNRVVERQPP